MYRESLLYTMLAVSVVLASASVSLAQTSTSKPADDVYGKFSKFCAENFGAEKEALTYQKFGKDLKEVAGGAWQRISENSACIAWETTLPARSYVEYGETDKYGAKTPETDKAYYLHIHHVKGLKTGVTYHYRTVSVDERGNKLASPDATFVTKKIDKAIYIPGDMGKPPYTLTTPGVYVLTEDIVADGTAINILGDVTLDLNGHTITYDNNAQEALKGDANDSKYSFYFRKGSYGIRSGYGGATKAKLYNGFIVQGQGNSAAAHPLAGVGKSEIAGIVATYSGEQADGFKDSNVVDCHHNIIVDTGEVVTNRHQGVDALVGGGKVHHNLIKRCRQRGIKAANNSEIFNNEIYIDSCATNSFGVFCYNTDGANCHDNRVFGTGYLAIGIGTVAPSVKNVKVTNNFIHLQGREPDTRWKEYGEQCGVYCVRVTWGGDNLDYADNYMITKARAGGIVRGIWYSPESKIVNVVFRNNIIKAVVEDEKSSRRGAIVVCGDAKADDAPGIFKDNIVYSNFCNVLLGEDYGSGCNAKFYNNKFVKIGPDRSDYRTIQIGFWTQLNIGHEFIDSTFEGGAGYDKMKFAGESKRELSVGWTLTVKTAPGAKVTITDKAGKEVFTGNADDKGMVSVPLMQYSKAAAEGKDPEVKTDLTPHTVKVEKDGKTATATVTMDKKQELELQPK